jgi:2-polyprenyl-6-methoxyphenol hydroxylase-like FAD-dependent oxidoreductase
MSVQKEIDPKVDSPELRFELVKKLGPAFIKPFRQVIDWMGDDTYISPDCYGTWETKKWDHKGGKVILAGDAAHAMTPRKYDAITLKATPLTELCRSRARL